MCSHLGPGSRFCCYCRYTCLSLPSFSWSYSSISGSNVQTVAEMSSWLLSLLAVTAGIVIFKLRTAEQRPAGCPPGPPTLPIIGNLHHIPRKNAHVQFKKWADEYGPVYSLVLGTTVTIVLSSDVAIKDLLDKRSGIYSSRPDMYIGSLASGGLRIVLMVGVSFTPHCAPAAS